MPRISRSIIYQLVTHNGGARIYGYYGRPYPYYGSPGRYWPYRRPYPPGGIATTPATPPNATTGVAATARNSGQTATQAIAQAGSMAARGRQAEQQAAKRAQARAQSIQQRASAEPADDLTVDRNGVVSMPIKSGTVSPSRRNAANVYDYNGKLMGPVEEVLVDTRSDHTAYVPIKHGGFLGLDPTMLY